IAGNLDTARKIEGFLMRLSSEVKLRKAEISEEVIKNLLGRGADEYAALKKERVSPEKIMDAVVNHFSTSKKALMGQARSKMIARPRQILMYLLRTELGIPLQEVGQIVGGRDHSTVIHAVDKITQLVSEDINTREDLLGIKKRY
ncbi:MAG: helix-turn-helix domain-containing protein, partial [Patescibacteria group bacterium]